ncbi:hypothetical protein Shal_1495 [Shewanella halifaxensis HAW-EB4]|uniref:O-antigen polymerase n=1 Tax=Shewanella halifaxensis (strain HAW-EB4) TaxID=458817 RepID=B0TMJ2_SHEHH|nr:hypothetical protein [Shewanella halifaxensis]ABZ76061.1 hypothetical protein Shal_1495 [Shewanella halifaxensis HAW-EB4]
MSNEFKLLIGLNASYAMLLLVSIFIDFGGMTSLFPLFVLFALLLVNFRRLKTYKFKIVELSILLLLFFGISAHVFLAPYLNITEFVKFLLIFVFYFIGLNVKFHTGREWRKMSASYSLFFLPLIFLLPLCCLIVYIFQSYSSGDSTGKVLFFSNRNNAIAFTFVCLFIYSALGAKDKIVYMLITMFTLLYSTLGALVALLFSIVVVNTKLTAKNILIFCVLLALSFTLYFYSELPIFERIKVMIHGFSEFLNLYSLEDVATLSFGEFAALQGGNDVSMFFRLKHWIEIFFIAKQNWLLLIPGWGMNASVELTNLKLVPHNDWLRILFELGIINFFAFSLLFLRVFFKLKSISKILCTLFLCINTYFFTENLINNFLVTSLLYFSAGMVVGRENIKCRT